MFPYFMDALDRGGTESKARLGTARVTQPGTAQVTLWVAGCSQAPPNLPRKGLTLGILCSPCTCWVPENPILTYPKDKTPIDPVGPKEGQSLVWGRRKIHGFGDSWVLRMCKCRMWRAEPPATSLAGKLSAAGSVCSWKMCLWNLCQTLGTARKSTVIVFQGTDQALGRFGRLLPS